MKFVKVLMMLVLALLIAAPVVSADDKQDKAEAKKAAKKDDKKADAKKADPAKKGKKPGANKGKNRRQAGPVAAVTQALAKLDLSQEQKDGVEKLVAEYSPKFKEVQAKRTAVLSPELVKKRQEATKQARADGKKGKDLQAAIAAAVSLTEEQKKTIQEVGKEQRALQTKFRAGVLALLTAEQVEASGLKKAAPKRVRGKQPPKNNPVSESADASTSDKPGKGKKPAKGGPKENPKAESTKKDTDKKKDAAK